MNLRIMAEAVVHPGTFLPIGYCFTNTVNSDILHFRYSFSAAMPSKEIGYSYSDTGLVSEANSWLRAFF